MIKLKTTTYETWQTIEKAIGKLKPDIFVKALGFKNASQIYAWMRPYNSYEDREIHNPVDRVEQLITTALVNGNHPKDAKAPLYYLCERFGEICYPIPSVEDTKDYSHRTEEMVKTLREFTEFSEAYTKSLTQSAPSEADKERIIKEGNDLLRRVAYIMECVGRSAHD